MEPADPNTQPDLLSHSSCGTRTPGQVASGSPPITPFGQPVWRRPTPTPSSSAKPECPKLQTHSCFRLLELQTSCCSLASPAQLCFWNWSPTYNPFNSSHGIYPSSWLRNACLRTEGAKKAELTYLPQLYFRIHVLSQQLIDLGNNPAKYSAICHLCNGVPSICTERKIHWRVLRRVGNMAHKLAQNVHL